MQVFCKSKTTLFVLIEFRPSLDKVGFHPAIAGFIPSERTDLVEKKTNVAKPR